MDLPSKQKKKYGPAATISPFPLPKK